MLHKYKLGNSDVLCLMRRVEEEINKRKKKEKEKRL